MNEMDLELPGGQRLHVYDTGPARHTVFWHHGTPNMGTPPAPLLRPDIRWVSYDRPAYGTSTPQAGRTVGSAAELVSAVADALNIDRFAVMGHSGGGSHAVACAAQLTDRVVAVAALATVAPFDAAEFAWFEAMATASAASLGAAAAGREAKEKYEASAEFDPDVFTPADFEALSGSQSWLGDVVDRAIAAGPAGLIDDDLAYVTPWACDPARITAPMLLLHGEEDRMIPASHSAWLAAHCPTAELRRTPGDGHISVLNHAPEALDWLTETWAQRTP
ncbi:alpha/beta fold hydrolase [Kibdelosporangium phytohabitans]|uniref:Alpha/beta hydrolase n=1 Tax=Kibdelosporangium phytohabitans TaxID=860235 RepID=A0A0N9HR97_9PSEU|nr:alpha/beta hydrolase [Kibdelosporangium phytohabitans]ALG05637.1 alpha/beta hydrolase [Kibdelosporangium phytohabitans]MBE1466387.1 pimeloyl-ACP methyl ester carboxylesterase [Kibdelosporangium phytohabitans]